MIAALIPLGRCGPEASHLLGRSLCTEVGRPPQANSTYVGYICRIRVMKLTGPLERVLRAFLADPAAPRYGYDLMKASGLPSGTLYPLLSRLQEQGLVSSAWEPAGTDASGRPARRYYWLTDEGIQTGREELARADSARPRKRGAGRAGTRGAARP